MSYYFQFTFTEGTSHEENWSFYPNAVRTAGFCGNPSFHLYWPNKKKDKTHNVLSSRELIIQPGYMMQFKVRRSGSLKLSMALHWGRRCGENAYLDNYKEMTDFIH